MVALNWPCNIFRGAHQHGLRVHADVLIPNNPLFHFISDIALAFALAPSRATCTVFVARLSPPYLTFEIEIELADFYLNRQNSG